MHSSRQEEIEVDVHIGDVSWGEKFAPSLKLSGAEYYDHLAAARRFLTDQESARDAQSLEIKRSEERISNATGDERESLSEDYYLNLYVPAVYDGAARSMAAVGMLAPLIESLLKRLIRVQGWKWPEHGSIVDQMAQIVRENEIDQMPPAWEATLRALFDYRNRMFHQGFEWPRNELDKV